MSAKPAPTPTVETANSIVDAMANRHVSVLTTLEDKIDQLLVPGSILTADFKKRVGGLFDEARAGWESEVKAAYASAAKLVPAPEPPPPTHSLKVAPPANR